MKKKFKIIIISLFTLLLIGSVISISLPLYFYLRDKKQNEIDKSTNFIVQMDAKEEWNPSSTTLDKNYIDQNQYTVIEYVQNSNIFKNNLPGDVTVSNWQLTYNDIEGEIYVSCVIDKYFGSVGNIIIESKTIKITIVGFKKTQYSLSKDQWNDNVNLGEKNTFSVVLSPTITNVKYEWFTSLNSTIIKNGQTAEITFLKSGVSNIVVNAILNSKIIATLSSSLNVIDNVSYDVQINSNNESTVGEKQRFEAIVKSSNGVVPNSLYYEWISDSNETIINNGKNIIDITWSIAKTHLITINVYSDATKTKLLATNNISVNVNQLPNTKYGFNVDGVDDITMRQFTNSPVEFDDIIKKANDEFNNTLTQDKLNQYLQTITNNYIDTYVSQRFNYATGTIVNNNVILNNDNSISGLVEINFTINNDLSSPSYSYAKGDSEYHTFIFENNKIDAYVNKSITNFLSFKLIPKYIKKEYRMVNTTKNKTIVVKDSPLYFDSIGSLTLQLNNSLFSIVPNDLLNNIYLYNSNISTTDQKQLIKEILSSILTKKARLICWLNNKAENPLRPNSNITNPILEIQLSKNYTISQSFITNLVWTLGSLFNFVQTKNYNVKILNNKLYMETSAAFISSINYPNKFFDFSNGYESALLNPYIEVPVNEIYDIERNIKELLITNNKTKITDTWNQYLDSLTPRDRVEKIYEFILPFVSYGQNNVKYPSSIGGYIEKKLICEGYANLFSYVANILKICSLTIIGDVKVNASVDGSGGAHAWNLVNVDGDWLWCDPTWDDGMTSTSNTYKKDNLMIDTEQFFTNQTHINVTNWSNGNDLPVFIPNFNNPSFPTNTELLIEGKELKSSQYVFEQKDTETSAKNRLNEYGVLNTFSLITKMYANSNLFFNKSNFTGIIVELLENVDYDKLKFKISATAKNKLTSWGRFPFAGITNGWKGMDVNPGDKIEVIFTYNRSSISSVRKENKFDTSRVFIGPKVSTTDFVGFRWNQVASNDLNLPYTTGFTSDCSIIKNSTTVRSSTGDNRTFFAFIYNYKNEYSQYGNKDIYMLCDNTVVT